jgi:hypothetical protein
VVRSCIAPSRRVTYDEAGLEAAVAVVTLGVALDLIESWSRSGDSDESEDNINDELHVD